MSRVPRIRFKGFKEDWEQRKLGEVTTSYSGGTPNVGNHEYYGDEIPFIRSGEINNCHTDLFITEKGLVNSSAAMVKEGDILYALYGATSGEVSRSKLKGAINQAILAILPKAKYNSEYIAQWLKIKKQYIVDMYLQGGQGNLSGNIVKNFIVDFSSYNEQLNIGNFASHLDHLITLHQRKLEKLKIIKKSMLENLFPKNGEKIPKIRFSGFTEDWEQCKLGEICQITMGQSPDGSTYSEISSDYILVQGNADLKDGWVYPRIWTTQKTKTANAGDLIMSVRAPAGTIGKTSYDVVLGRGVAGIKGSEFIYQLLVKMDLDDYWKKLAMGSTFESINSDVVNGAELMVTENIDEQNRIGDYFDSLDHLITLHQSKLDKLQKIKKSMLESMFI